MDQGQDFHWFILGAGAIGSLWASQLIKSRVPCSLIVRPHRLQAISKPETLTLTEGSHSRKLPVKLCAPPLFQAVPALLVTTKAGDTLAALDSIRASLVPEAPIVLLQNGMGSQQQVAAAFPEHPVYAGTTTDGAWQPEFLSVVRAGRGQTLLGALNSKALALAEAPLRQLLSVRGMDIRFTDNIETMLWKKLAINSAINGLTALHDCPNGDLLKPACKPQVDRLCQETLMIAQAEGIDLPADFIHTVHQVLEVTAANYSSTLQDVRNRRTTELPYINGYLLRCARKRGIAIPEHEQLIQRLEHMGISSHSPEPAERGD